jgi:ribonuclease Z
MITSVACGPYTVRGVSLGGVYTSIHVPELSALFDVGIPMRSAAAVDHLFISHGHVDHVGALPSFLGLRGLTGVNKTLNVYAPARICDTLREILAAFSQVHRWALEVALHPMEPGDELPLQARGDLRVKAFRTWHTVPSLGYMVFRRVRKLREAFKDLPGPEIGRRRRAGEDLFDVVERRELAYATDTLPRVLEQSPEIAGARVLVLECTFLDSRKTLEAARAGAHIHLDELLPLLESVTADHIVLMHLSQMYRPDEAHALLAERIPGHIFRRVRVFAPTEGGWPG